MRIRTTLFAAAIVAVAIGLLQPAPACASCLRGFSETLQLKALSLKIDGLEVGLDGGTVSSLSSDAGLVAFTPANGPYTLATVDDSYLYAWFYDPAEPGPVNATFRRPK